MNKKHWMAFQAQRHQAKVRGIDWQLTFDEWLTWWGEDVERRGRGPADLQMQRFADAGPYALDNIKKGTPMQNSRTAAAIRRNEKSAVARAARTAHTEQLMAAEAGEKLRDSMDDDEKELHSMFFYKVTGTIYG